MSTENQVTEKDLHGNDITLQDLYYLCLTHWYWFAISLVVCLGLATIYLKVTEPTYTRTAQILIKEDKKGKNATSALDQFSDIGIFASNTNVNNEIGTLESPDLMLQVIQKLNLDYNYKTDATFRKRTLYGKELPVKTLLVDVQNPESASFKLVLNKDGNYKMEDLKFNGEDVDSDVKEVKGVVGDTIQTPLGRLIVSNNPDYEVDPEEELETMNVYVHKLALSDAKKKYSDALKVSQNDEKSSIIVLSFNDVSKARANDVLNNLIASYNENWVKDKNQVAISTSMFINDRLGVIEGELGNVDSDISAYKSEHLVPDVQSVANIYLKQATDASNAIKELNNSIYMARYIRNYLTNEANRNELIPSSTGLNDATLATQIKAYNDLMLERNSLLVSSSERNPLVQQKDKELNAMRSALITAIDNQIVALNTQIQSNKQMSGQATSQIASNPKQSKYLLSVERQQKVKESLYLYLLQKREENELNQAFTAYNTRVISVPDGNKFPTAPVTRNVYLIAFVLGLVLPLGILYLRESFNTVVRGRKDIEMITAPFVGEIPQNAHTRKGLFKRRKKVDAGYEAVVKPRSRNIINEAFRVVRTNLEFMLAQKEGQGGVVIAMTSINVGSGKTFITYNLSTALAIKDKKVLCIDLDLRKGSLSRYIGKPKIGISNYLVGQVTDLSSIIVHDTKNGLDMIPLGVMPPNPTELLFNGRLDQALEELRKEYDYIFLDCPPVEIIADAAIINKMVDYTLFVIRAGVFERSLVPEVERFYRDKKYKNLTIILNGTEGAGGRYGMRYGYRYGYSYGYATRSEISSYTSVTSDDNKDK